jgi:hypothetical protein
MRTKDYDGNKRNLIGTFWELERTKDYDGNKRILMGY